MNPPNLAAFRVPQEQRRVEDQPRAPRAPKVRELFLIGKIPWTVLTKAAQLGGACIGVCLALELQRKLDRKSTISPRRYLMASLNILIGAETRALLKLERAGLVRVKRSRGRRPRVTLRWTESGIDGVKP